MVKLLVEYGDEVKAVVLGNAPCNAKYTSPLIQNIFLIVWLSKLKSTIFQLKKSNGYSKGHPFAPLPQGVPRQDPYQNGHARAL